MTSDAIITKYEKETQVLLQEASYYTQEQDYGTRKYGRNMEDWDEDLVTE